MLTLTHRRELPYYIDIPVADVGVGGGGSSFRIELQTSGSSTSGPWRYQKEGCSGTSVPLLASDLSPCNVALALVKRP